MADGKIKISELNEALQMDDNAEFPYAQENGGVQTTFKGPVSQIARKIAEGITYTNLETTAKTLVGAINELSHLGNPILLGTTAPTSSQGANGNIYVQYTEGTGGDPDTVDSIYAKIDGAWCQISTGGGSGGHTIVDDDGTSLTQRTNLQFKGAYSEDNSTDDTTEVNVIREMTKAEFDLLSAAEKTGLINITDITGGNDDRFQPVIYSEDEREIGVWIDGKPVYQKTIDFGSDLTVNYNGWTETTEDCSSVDKYLYGDGYTSGGTYGGNILCSKKSNDKLEIQTARNGTSQIIRYLTVRYTKSTDQAGSGQWTPQGVPTHHYSTDEQVVGTWIDGSTIYEKTFDLTSVSLTNATWTNNVLGTSSSNIKIRKFSGTFNITGGSYTNEPYADYIYYRSENEYFTAVVNDTENDLNLRPQINGVTITAGVCTIQYTKTST